MGLRAQIEFRRGRGHRPVPDPGNREPAGEKFLKKKRNRSQKPDRKRNETRTETKKPQLKNIPDSLNERAWESLRRAVDRALKEKSSSPDRQRQGIALLVRSTGKHDDPNSRVKEGHVRRRKDEGPMEKQG